MVSAGVVKALGDATLYLGDCLDVMKKIPDASVDLVAADLPYGTTQCAWDSIIPLESLWGEYKRVLKPTGAVALTSAMPFTAVLVASNLPWFRHDLVWQKNRATGHLNANRSPLRAHESILIFSPGKHVYNPQKTDGHKPVNTFYTRHAGDCFGAADKTTKGGGQTTRYPVSILPFPVVSNSNGERLHPTQKPVSLFEWVIASYSNPGDTVLDNCIGSGSSGVAALRLGRRYIGIEKYAEHFKPAVLRISSEIAELTLARAG